MTRPDSGNGNAFAQGHVLGTQRPGGQVPQQRPFDAPAVDDTGEIPAVPAAPPPASTRPDYDPYAPGVYPAVSHVVAPAQPAAPQPAVPPAVQPAGPSSGSITRSIGSATISTTATATVTTTATATGTAAATRATAFGATSRPSVLAQPIDVPPDPPRPGTVYGSQRVDDGPGRIPGGRLARLHVGWHSASLRALSMIGVSSPGTGLILGADADHKPVPVRFFRPETTRVTLVGGVWAAQLVAFRALALGAQAVVTTNDPAAWHGFGERATGTVGRVVVNGGGQMSVPGTAQRPVLVIHDLGPSGPAAGAQLGPWQTQMTILRQLDERGVPAIQDGHLVMMQRLDISEATLAVSALRLTGGSAQNLQQLADDMFALVGGGADRYMWFRPTDAEQKYAGTARR